MNLRTFTSKAFVVLTSLLFIGIAAPATADTISLMWDANTEPQVTGYMVHVGTQPGTYTQHVDVGLSTTFALPSAVAGQQYCFAVSAYVAGPLEGLKSSEVCGYSNAPPTLVNPGARTSTQAQAASLQLQGSDPLGQPVTYAATGLPQGLTLMASTGFISGTPTTVGTSSVTATVSDGTLSASQTFTWTITAPGADTTVPVVTITGPTSASTYTATAATIAVSGTASDNVGVTQVTWVNSRGGSGTATGTTSWSVSSVALQSGSNTITVTARDAAGNIATDVVTVTLNTSVPPTLAVVPNQSTFVGQAVSLQLIASGLTATMMYGAQGLPPGLSISSSTGLISGTTTSAGTYSVLVGAGDATLNATRTFTWTVTAAPDTTAPAVTITGPTSAATFAASAASIALNGTASDNTGVTQVTWANNRGGSGTATGTTSWSVASVALQSGANVVTVTARDAAGNTASDVLTVNVNSAPALTAPANQNGNVGQPASLQLAGSDPDGNALTYSATGLPAGLSVNATTGVISGTPTAAGTFSVTATVSDGTLTASRTFGWTIVATDTTAPVVTITGPTAAATFASTTSTLTVSGSASDNVGVTQVSWVNSRGGAGTATGTTTWSVPGIALVSGQNVITVTARDAAGNTSSAVLTVSYNVAPVLTAIADQFIEVGRFASVSLSGSDADGDTLTYSANGLPPGMAIVVATGVISGTPTDAGTYPVTATVFDGTQSSSRNFTWTVTGDVTAPVVAITQPATSTYSTVAASMTIAGSASDIMGVTQVSWTSNRGGSGIATGTTAWTAAVALQGGVNVITVTARDAAGNVSTAVVTATMTGDETVPVVTITSPTSAATYPTTGTTLTVRGSASDNVGVVAVTWTNSRGGSGTASGTTSWTVSGVTLQSGSNVITVTARDAAGNTATDVLTVTVTLPATAPVVSAIANQSGRVGQPVSLQVVATDVNGDTLQYGALQLPPGVVISATTGLISGTPTTAGTYSVSFGATDGTLYQVRTFTWTIAR